MITLLLILALESITIGDGVQSACRDIANGVRECHHYHGPTTCEAATVWMCTMGGDEANVGIVDQPWTWPDHWVTYGPPTGESW